jgi:hypothetical protein
MNVFGPVGWWEPVVSRAGVSQETEGVSNESLRELTSKEKYQCTTIFAKSQINSENYFREILETKTAK